MTFRTPSGLRSIGVTPLNVLKINLLPPINVVSKSQNNIYILRGKVLPIIKVYPKTVRELKDVANTIAISSFTLAYFQMRLYRLKNIKLQSAMTVTTT
jgi:hypothetical protein